MTATTVLEPEVTNSQRQTHPIASLLAKRLPFGLLSIVVASVLVYWATMILPGDTASAILGQSATPERLAELRSQLGLDQGALQGFLNWATGVLHGDFGISLAQQRPVWEVVGPRLLNSAVLVAVVAILSTTIGIAAGLVSARRPDGVLDTVVGLIALVASALPEFVVGVLVVLALAVGPFHVFPALSAMPSGLPVWDEPSKLVLPILTLVIVVTPYVYRMVRAATIEALTADYAEVANLKGTSPTRLLVRHALPNALAPSIQVVGLNLLYLAGGIVMVETVFAYPGVGLTLVDAVNTRDVQLVQFLVILLAVFYVLVNICADVFVLLVTPRKRFPR